MNRAKCKNLKKCVGCDLDYVQRNSVLKVGEPVLGALKTQSPDLFQDQQRDMNINLESPHHQKIENEIYQRPFPESSFDSENTYRNLSTTKRRPRNFSELMNYGLKPMNHTNYGQSFSSNYYYFNKLSKPQKGHITPVRSREKSRSNSSHQGLRQRQVHTDLKK